MRCTPERHGSGLQVMPFFNSMGFELPKRKGIADFLQEVTSVKDQEQYWCAATPGGCSCS